jgi:hypothetical protein
MDEKGRRTAGKGSGGAGLVDGIWHPSAASACPATASIARAAVRRYCAGEGAVARMGS